MGIGDHVTFYNAITQIEAQEALLAMSVAEFPHLSKKEERKKRHKEMHKLAFPKTHTSKQALDIESFSNFLNINSKKVT